MGEHQLIDRWPRWCTALCNRAWDSRSHHLI